LGYVTKDKSQLLDKLVSDSITFGLNLKEALEYIRRECPDCVISERTYFRRRRRLLTDKTRNSWFSHFTRIGFVQLHKKLMEGLEKCYEDTMHQLFVEQHKNPRNESLIIKLKMTHMEQVDMLAELSLGTPVIAAISAKLDKSDQGLEFHYMHSLGKQNKY
jgi:hypothetical protein